MEDVLSRFTDGLKSPLEDARLSTALKLRRYIGSELKEISPHNYALFIEDLCSEFKCMLEGSDVNEKRGAILGIGCLAEVDFLSISGHCGQFTSLVKSLAASGDLPTLVLGARLLGQFGLLFSSDFVDLQIKGACDSLLMANQSNSQKEFNILLLREIALHTPTSFYQHLEQFLKAVLPSFREKEVIVRDLAALALRSALAISAENEVSCQGREALSSTGRLGEAADSPDALFYSQSSKSDAGGGPRKQVGRGGSLLVPASRKISQTQIPTDMPPMTWYQACVRELLFKYSDAIALKPSDQHSTNKYSPSYRKMTSDEWLHGRLLILNELLVSANPEFEKVRSSLDTMLGQAMFHVLIANQTEGETAVQTVHLTQWAVVSAPTAAASAAVAAVVSSGLPRSALSSTTARPAAGEVFGDEGIASELFRQQQLRQQRAVPVASAACRRVLADNMEQVWPLVLSALHSKVPCVLHLILKVLPRLVAFEGTQTPHKDLIQTLMNFLFDCVNRDREKAYALVTLGLMAQSLGAEFETGGYMTRLFEILSSLISPSKETASKKRPAGLSTAVLLTVGLLTKALGSKVYPYLKPLLDPIISRGLSQPMAAVCSLIAENVPELKRNVQDNLLKRINLVLANASAAGTLLSPAGGVGGLMTQSTSAAVTAAAAVTAPSGGRFSVVGTSRLVAAFTPHRSSISRSPLLPSSASATGRTGSITLPGTAAMPIGWGDAFGGLLKSGGGGSGVLDHEGTGGDPLSDSMLAAVALRTLGSFDFEGHALAYFVKHTADNFISISTCSVKEIRLEGVRTCLRLMLPWIKSAEDMPASLRKTLDAMSDILGKLLVVGTSDPDPDVRQCVFDCLDFHFDNYVAQSDHLSSLFVALNDEVFAIRCLVMQCLGRLSEINPACVQPTLRKALLGLLIDLSDSGSSRNKEESASLLAILVATSPRFVAPYAEPLLHILVPQIRNALPISLRLRLLAMRNASLQKSAAKLGGADFFDCQKASLTTALLTSQSAAHAAAQTVQAVATATARAGGAPGNGGGTDKAAGTASTAIRGGGNAGGANQQLFGARAIAAANHAATTASIAAKVVAAAVGRQGLNFGGPATMLPDDFEKFNSNLGFASPPRVISNLDLLIGDPNESLPGTNQDFLSVAAELDLTNLTNALSSMSECLDDSHALASKGLFCAPKAGQPEGSAIAMWREPTPVVVALFSVLGHLSGVCPAAVVPLMDDLLPILTCMLQDSTCYAKRSIAAWTLSVMITNTGFVVLPYLKHPDLLDLLFGLLKREESKNIQAELVRLLGLIGAVDPFKLKMCAGQMDSLQDTGVAVSMHDTVESREIDITQSELLVNFFWESKEEFFAAYCLSALINLLREPVMRSQCDKVVLAIYNVVSSLGQRSIPYLHQVMRELFQCLQSLQDARLQETLLYHLGSIVSIIGPHAKEFVHDVVNIIVAHWWISPAVQRAAIRLLGSVSNVLGSDFRPFISRLTPTLLRMLKQETDETNLKALFDLMGDLGVLLEGHVHILVPTMAHLIGNTEEESLDLLLRSALEQSTNAASGAAFPSQPTTDSSSTAAAAASSCSPESVELMATAGSSPPLNAPLGQDASTVLLEDNWRPGALLQWTSAGSQRQAFAGGCHVVGSIALRRAGLQCFLKFTECLALDSLCATITHPICRLLTLLHERQYLAGGVGSGTGAGAGSSTGGSSLLQQAGGAPPASHLGGGSRQGRSGVGGSNAGLSGTGGGGGMAGARAALQALFPPCMDVITNLLARMGPKFQVVMPIVQMTLNLLGMSHPAFSTVLSKVVFSGPTVSVSMNMNFVSELTLTDDNVPATRPTPELDRSTSKTHTLNSLTLERAWRSTRLVSTDDWNQWLKTLSNAMLRESPSPAIRACARLIGIAPTISRTLFNAAFMSCWPELTDQLQDDLIATLESVLRLSSQTTEISQVVLNLEEFMAHVDKYSGSAPRMHLPLSLNMLADRAMRNRSYAKALRYKELEFLEEIDKRSSPTPATLSALLAIYDKLQLSEASTGVLLYATRDPRTKLADEELWYEKLRDWDRAIALCDRKLEDERIKDKTKPILCRLRCLHSLGQWGQLDSMAWERWNGVSEVTRQQMAPLATSAAITVGAWDRAEHYANSLPASSYEAGFYRSVLALHTGNYARALDEVAKARAVLAADLTPLTGEGYLRAYPDLVAAQLLAEVEEVIQYKLIPERCAVLHDSWHKRLIGCHSVVEDWGRIIQLRRLVLDPNKNIRSCLRYAGLCRRSGRLSLSLQVLLSVMGFNPATVPPTQPIIGPEPSTVFAYTKILWASGSKEEAFTRLRVLREAILEPMLCAETTTTNGVVVGGARHDYVNVDPTASAAAGAAGTVGSTYSSTAAQAAVSAAASAGNWCDLASASVDAAAVRARMSDLRKLLSKVCMRLGNWYSELYLRTPSEVVTLPGSKSAGTHLVSPSIGQPYSGVGDVQQTNLLLSLDGGSIGRSPCVNLLDEKAVYSHRFVINCYRTATEHTPGNRFAWQAWAIANYDLFTRLGMEKAQLEQYEGELRQAFNAGLDIPYRSQPSEAPFASAGDHPGNQSAQQTPAATVQQTLAALAARRAVLQRSMEQLAAPSVRGYINSISISPDANLQDSLRLINLLFQFGHLSEIRDLIREGFGKIRLQNWLVVLQQLLARIDTPLEHVANIIVDLLVAVGRRYPQALVFSLVLAFKSGGSDRRRYYANKILYSMEEHSQQLVSEAFLLNEELIRISITWVEMWAECLEDASRVYFGEKDIGKMFRLLHPLHLVMDRGHETNNEAAFLQQFGTELTNCRLYCERFEQLGAKADLQQAWDGYYTLYRNFSKLVSNMSILELTVTAPRLQAYGKDWQLAVPGSYKPQRPLIRMAGVKNCLTVMTSKQHPRRLTILGSNGQNYVFLLKGHEDTRQDERIMQFFGLVNTLLMSEPETLRRNLTIQRFSVIPLSTNTGLIGWVPNSDTLHSLIRDYREKSGILLNQEHREMLRLAPDFDRLNLSQKTEVFEAGLRESSGRDLANILWLKSHNSEAWFERRTTFIRSMAVMSMVGYILGLGDRHPSNLMLCRETGKVVHIDFGDCFEVAMMREKFPEKVPFRLTRMIIAAMEVTGIDGVYRHTCDTVMQLMRQNRDSLLAVLEAFIHDPLLQWVLLENKKSVFAQPDSAKLTNQAAGAAGQAPPAAGTAQTQATRMQPQQQQQSQQSAAGGAGRPQASRTPQLGSQQRPPQTTATGAGVNTAAVGGGGGGMTSGAVGRQTGAMGTGAPSGSSRLGAYGQTPASAHSRNAPRVFTNPAYPASPSLRDYHKVNPWRHHLCNGPWLGCYETAKTMRRQTESGSIIGERKGLQAFIFSAKLIPENDGTEDSPGAAFGNAKARDVLNRIRRKLDGNESGQVVTVHQQVDDLIREATSSRNICQMYIGWCGFW